MESHVLNHEENTRNHDSTSSMIKINNYHLVLDLPNFLSSKISQPIPFVLSFNNLTYSVKAGPKTRFHRMTVSPESNTKSILKDVSGEAREGEIMAILGASGSGKSTLIDAIASRITKHSLKGSVTLNGEVLSSGLLKLISAYVMQDDLLFPMLTVEETLMFSAEFRLPRSLSKSKKKSRVQALIDQLGLRSAAKTVIGDEGHRGVSGGERRRVSIGVDIIHDPILLFLDEPTSGLDSTSAFMVVKVLKRIARSGSVVIMSVHQPSYRILGLFDRLIFLSQGQTLYSGSPANLPEFFADFGHQIPKNENPVEFALDFIRELEKTPDSQSLVEFNISWQAVKNPSNKVSYSSNLSLKDAIRASICRGKLVSGAKDDLNPTSSVPSFANPFWIEVLVLLKRLSINSTRMPEVFGVRLAAIIITGIIVASVFWKLDDTPRGMQERLGFVAFVVSTSFYMCTHEIPEFIQERFIFMRETAYNAYRRSSYVVARSLISIPSMIIFSITFVIITFWSTGLAGGLSGLFFFMLTIFASFWAGSSFVAFLSAWVCNILISFDVVMACFAYFTLFCGFFISRTRIPGYWIWFHYLSVVKYPYEAMLLNEFQDPIKCFVRGVEIFDDTPIGELTVPMKINLLKSLGNALGTNITASTCLTTGQDILLKQGVTQLNKWYYLLITIAWGFFFRILFYFVLFFGSRNKRK